MSNQTNTKRVKAEPKAVKLRAVYGYMAHPFTGETFDQNRDTDVEVVDSWTQAQLDAGKLIHAAG